VADDSFKVAEAWGYKDSRSVNHESVYGDLSPKRTTELRSTLIHPPAQRPPQTGAMAPKKALCSESLSFKSALPQG
jgi:hypothetical protein